MYASPKTLSPIGVSYELRREAKHGQNLGSSIWKYDERHRNGEVDRENSLEACSVLNPHN